MYLFHLALKELGISLVLCLYWVCGESLEPIGS